MSKNIKMAIAFSALLSFAAIQPAIVSFAASSPNTINNQTAQLVSPVQSELGRSVGQGRPAHSGAGVYDSYDSYRSTNGFPLPGNAQLFEPID